MSLQNIISQMRVKRLQRIQTGRWLAVSQLKSTLLKVSSSCVFYVDLKHLIINTPCKI